MRTLLTISTYNNRYIILCAESNLDMKVFIVVAVIIVTICLACLMKAKAEGDRIYDELAYKHFSSKEERKGEQTERYG